MFYFIFFKIQILKMLHADLVYSSSILAACFLGYVSASFARWIFLLIPVSKLAQAQPNWI